MYVVQCLSKQEVAISISLLSLMITLDFFYVYLMKWKSEAFEKFKEFKVEVENQLGKRIKAI